MKASPREIRTRFEFGITEPGRFLNSAPWKTVSPSNLLLAEVARALKIAPENP